MGDLGAGVSRSDPRTPAEIPMMIGVGDSVWAGVLMIVLLACLLA